ncbi:MAG: CvpA family protein [Arcobacteraceae bacterium]|jgi:membrane protein required for colicin V production|nr:CvpA family protein [Arcobacteraceae bacterium]
MENLGSFDIIILGLVILLGLKGLFRGLIRELFAIFGIIGGIFIASRIAGSTGGLIDAIIGIENHNTMLLLGFVLSLIIIWTAAYFLGIFLSKMFSLSGLGIFDKILGFAFGAGKIFLLFSIIVFALSNVEIINKKMENLRTHSIMFPLLVSCGGYIIKINNENLQQAVENKLDTVANGTKTTINSVSNDIIDNKLKKIQEK